MNDQYSDRKISPESPVTQAEQLSALFDGQLAGDPLRFLLRSVDSDPALAQRWSRYQVASMVIQRQYVHPATGDAFVSAVMARLDKAPVQIAVARRAAGGRVLRWAGGGAIAAAVAVVALVASRPVGDGASPLGSTTVASVPAAGGNASTNSSPLELRAFAAPQSSLPAGFVDYAQPASYESNVPAYSLPTLRGQTTQNAGENFVPYVLVVGSRKPLQPQLNQPQAAKRN